MNKEEMQEFIMGLTRVQIERSKDEQNKRLP